MTSVSAQNAQPALTNGPGLPPGVLGETGCGEVVTDPIESVLARYEGSRPSEPPKRKPGRPKKRTPEYLRTLLRKHVQIREWFEHEFDQSPRSDRELYTQYFAHLFLTRGLRGSRAAEPRFQRTLKTTLNELSEARRQFGRGAVQNLICMGAGCLQRPAIAAATVAEARGSSQ
jgi:hypothetical protein